MNREGLAARLDGRPGPIVSVHIPKTGGTSFAAVLVRELGPSVAFCYNADHPRTHSLLRDPRTRFEAETLEALAAEGVRVVHGHDRAEKYLAAAPDPARYWAWVRDPVERLISRYAHLQAAGAARPDKARRLADVSLLDFARRGHERNKQSRMLAGLDVAAMGFVGVTERYDESLSVLGLAPLEGGRRKAAPTLVSAAEAERDEIAALHAEDAALHRAANAWLDRALARS